MKGGVYRMLTFIREYDLFIRFLTATPRQRQEEERTSKVNRDKVQKKGLRL